MALLTVPSPALFVAICAGYRNLPRWYIGVAVTGMVLTVWFLVLFLVDTVRKRMRLGSYFFPAPLAVDEDAKADLIERIRIPAWITTVPSTMILVCVAGPLVDRYKAPWWLVIAAYLALIGCWTAIEGAAWSAYRRARARV